MDARQEVAAVGDRVPRRAHRRRVVLVRGLVVLGVLSIALLGVLGWHASGIVHGLLRSWAVEAVSQLSDSV
jgi:hypothetical protein